MISEYAPGQYELTLHYRTDVMQAADDLMRLKRIVRLQARQHGVTACFMAKPVEDYAGSGMHFHVSLVDGAGRNVFVEETEGQWNPTLNNRSVALRIPAGDIKARRIEHRPAGVDSNPYLVAATVLAGIRHGLKHRIDPGPETTGNGYEGAADAPPIPADWRMAIDAAQKSDFLKDALGEDMHRTFTAIKAAEYARVARTVSEVDYDLYLYTV